MYAWYVVGIFVYVSMCIYALMCVLNINTYLTIEDPLLMIMKPLPYMIEDPALFADILSTYGLISNEVMDQVFYSRGCTNHVFLNLHVLIEFVKTNRTSPQESVQQLLMLLEEYDSVLLNTEDIFDSMKNIACKLRDFILTLFYIMTVNTCITIQYSTATIRNIYST